MILKVSALDMFLSHVFLVPECPVKAEYTKKPSLPKVNDACQMSSLTSCGENQVKKKIQFKRVSNSRSHLEFIKFTQIRLI